MSDDDAPIFPQRDIDLPLTDPDALPLDEVTLRPDKSWATGITYWHFLVPGFPESHAGWRDPEVARRKGAEVLKKQRQIRAMGGDA